MFSIWPALIQPDSVPAPSPLHGCTPYASGALPHARSLPAVDILLLPLGLAKFSCQEFHLQGHSPLLTRALLGYRAATAHTLLHPQVEAFLILLGLPIPCSKSSFHLDCPPYSSRTLGSHSEPCLQRCPPCIVSGLNIWSFFNCFSRHIISGG